MMAMLSAGKSPAVNHETGSDAFGARQLQNPRVLWVNRSFLDYRVPVYAELDVLLGHNLWILFSSGQTPERVQEGITRALGARAVALDNERLVRIGSQSSDFANRWIEVGYQPRLLRKIIEIDPDIIIGEGFFRWTLPALYFALSRKRPLVVSYERTRFTERGAQWFRTLYRKAILTHVNAIACNGTLSAEYLAYLGYSKSKVFVGSMAAEVGGPAKVLGKLSEPEREARRSSLGVRGIVFLYVGQLVVRKGIHKLLPAWNLLSQDSDIGEATLVIVGNGPERATLERLVCKDPRHPVVFLGEVSHAEIALYYRMADVFIIPTLEDNWSLVVPEAMACGLPILTSVFNGCWPELVRSEVNGFTFDPFCSEEITDLIRRLIADPGLRHRMGSASRRIAEDFTPAHAARVIHDACLHAIRSVGTGAVRPGADHRKRVAIVTNEASPYRLDFFARIGSLAGICSRVFFQDEPRDIHNPPFSAPMRFEYGSVPSIRIRSAAGQYRYLSPLLLFHFLRFRPHVIVVGGAPFAAFLSLIVGAMRGTKVLVWWGGTERSERWQPWVTKIWRQWLFPRINGFLAYSTECARYLERQGVTKGRIKVIGNNTLDVQRYTSGSYKRAHSFAVRGGEINILVVSRLIPSKNVLGALGVFERLVSRGQKATLTIAGDGPEREDILRECAKRDLVSVRLLGRVPAHRMARVYAEADVFLHLAKYDQWPQAVNEAMAHGMPVVVSRTSGVDESFLQHGVHGFLVDPEDGDGTAELLFRLAGDRSILMRMGNSARDSAKANDVNALVDKFREALSDFS